MYIDVNAKNGLKTWAWLHLSREVGLDVVKRDLHINQVFFLLIKCFILALFIISATVEINRVFLKNLKQQENCEARSLWVVHDRNPSSQGP